MILTNCQSQSISRRFVPIPANQFLGERLKKKNCPAFNTTDLQPSVVNLRQSDRLIVKKNLESLRMRNENSMKQRVIWSFERNPQIF